MPIAPAIRPAPTLPNLYSLRAGGRLLAVVGAALTVANCSAPSKVASRGREIDPKYGVVASPRVVEDGQPIPKGGGRALVGRPYQVAGRTYTPRENPSYSRVGLASWYGAAFHGRLTANGEIFDRQSIAAAHTTMPLPSYARVTNLQNSRSIIVRVNDRGPYHANRVLDVSERVAEALDFRRSGTAKVQVDYVGRASTNGSDDTKLLATLRTDGDAAPFPGRGAAPVMVAEAAPPAPVMSPTRIALAEPEEEAITSAPEPLRRAVVPRAPAPLPIVTAAMPSPVLASAGRLVNNVPLPPERPFDLRTAPSAAAPARAGRPPVAQGSGRAVYAATVLVPPGTAQARETAGRSLR